MPHKDIRDMVTRCQNGRDTHSASLELLLAKIIDKAITAVDIARASFILDRICGKVLQIEEADNAPRLMLNYSPEYLKSQDEK